MSTQYGGLPNNTAGSILSPVNISSSTNASPIVVTTTSPHGVNTGDTVVINDHLVNTGANGIFTAGAVTSTTVVLVGSTGTGVGGATGTLRCMALGATYPIPSDGDALNAASLNVALEALGDRTAYLYFIMYYFLRIYEGGKLTIDSGGMVNNQGRTQFRPTYFPADAATIVLDTTMGDVVQLANPALVRDVQLRTSVNPPQLGERMRIQMPQGYVDGLAFRVKRDDVGSTLIAELHGHSVTESGIDKQGNTWIEVVYENRGTGGKWYGLTATGYVVTSTGWA